MISPACASARWDSRSPLKPPKGVKLPCRFTVGFIAAFALGLIFHATGKDQTLTGRTEIWSAVWSHAMSRPLTGFGFAAFWTQTSIPAKILAQQTGWNVLEAHYAWLDLLVGIGWIGAAFAAACCYEDGFVGGKVVERPSPPLAPCGGFDR